MHASSTLIVAGLAIATWLLVRRRESYEITTYVSNASVIAALKTARATNPYLKGAKYVQLTIGGPSIVNVALFGEVDGEFMTKLFTQGDYFKAKSSLAAALRKNGFTVNSA